MRDYFEAGIIDQIDADSEMNVVGKAWPGSEVYKAMEAKGLEEYIDVEVEKKKLAAKERARAFLAETECIERFQLLCELQKAKRVLPFVGAGMSRPSGFKLWSELLIDLTADSAELRERVTQKLASYEYEDAAQDICDTLSQAALNHDIRAHLGRAEYQLSGAVQLLPYCFKSGCITTNLDNVLERVFLAANNTFNEPIFGSHIKEQRGFLNPDENKLYKLHGTALIPNGRVLTRQEYDQTYANDISLSRVLGHIIGARHLLFLGYSLGVDRTVQELAKLFADAPNNYPEHYAFLPLDDKTGRERWFMLLGA